MDGDRFDAIARAAASVTPRRSAFKLLTGGLLAAALARLSSEEAAAACVRLGRGCGRGDRCCGGGDCRGGTCKCTNGQRRCRGRCIQLGACCIDGDCTAGKSCVGGACADATCSDGRKNGGETGVDCGGPDCPPCANGKTCADNSDCAFQHCCGGVCAECCRHIDCGLGRSCVDDRCRDGCAPRCAGKQCGDDGCGGTCGQCSTGTRCRDHQCVAACGTIGETCGLHTDCCDGQCGERPEVAGVCCIPDGQPAEPADRCCSNATHNPGDRVLCGERPCTPRSCADQGLACGAADDDCGHPLDCGTCSGGKTCQGGSCACPTGEKLCRGECILATRCCVDDDCTTSDCRRGTCCTHEDGRLRLCRGQVNGCYDLRNTCVAANACESATCDGGVCRRAPAVVCPGCQRCNPNDGICIDDCPACQRCNANRGVCEADTGRNGQTCDAAGRFCENGVCTCWEEGHSGCSPGPDSRCCTGVCSLFGQCRVVT